MTSSGQPNSPDIRADSHANAQIDLDKPSHPSLSISHSQEIAGSPFQISSKEKVQRNTHHGSTFCICVINIDFLKKLTKLTGIRPATLSYAMWQRWLPALNVTISVGIAEHMRKSDAVTTFKKADETLYRAKENGRNACMLALSE